MASLIPEQVEWIQKEALEFVPEKNELRLREEEGKSSALRYRRLVVAPGLELDWGAIEGLEPTLGRNGVTSNYDFSSCQYTAELVEQLSATAGGRRPRAIFTQPPMPIKCAGAPQKALYLSAHAWESAGAAVDLTFCSAGPALFGVKEFVPTLQGYMDRYGATECYGHTLVAVDGQARRAKFQTADGQLVEKEFEMLHVVPPMRAPRCVRESPLADATGFVAVEHDTLRHVDFENVFAAGDCVSAPNAKTMAAARKQAPVVVHNLLQDLAPAAARPTEAVYDGYGACPLTVEKGKVVLAEFGWGGQLMPSFPGWLIKNTAPSRLAWAFKRHALPWFYWHIMLPGRSWCDPMSWPSVREKGER